jgi:hypothetical protein
MSLDVIFDYKRAKDQIGAIKSYNELKGSYDEISKDAGDFFNEKKSDITQGVNKVKSQVNKFQRDVKNQFQQLLDINNTLDGKNSNSFGSLKRIMLKTIQLTKPYLNQILFEESINAIGCDQQQSFTGQTFYIKVPSIDLLSMLKYDPADPLGSFLYEPNQIQTNSIPFSMNRQLYQLTQSNLSYSGITGQNYKGLSGQDLFDIKFVEQKPITNEYGPWYEVTLINKVSGVNKVGEFLLDYFQTIDIADFNNVMGNIMEALTGCFSISANVGVKQIENATQFELFIQRVLGLCFDNDEEINTSGIAKLGELDNLDDSFFEFTELDLRKIETKVENIKNGVVEFLQCDNVKFPVNAQAIVGSVLNLRDVPESDQVEQAARLTSTLINNPNWRGLSLDVNIETKIDYNFINAISQGLTLTALSPKVLLPIFVVLKAVGQDAIDNINNFTIFIRQFKTFVINIISKFGAIFVEKLFEIIKAEIQKLLRRVIQDLFKEKQSKIYTIILTLIQLLLLIGSLISDWRKCKSVIDEILGLLRLITTGWGGEIPLPLLFASQLLDGYSESRAFIGSIEEMQKLGIPTGALPSGAPNLQMLSIFGQLKAQANEKNKNGKTQIAIGPLTITPAGVTVPASAFGKDI